MICHCNFDLISDFCFHQQYLPYNTKQFLQTGMTGKHSIPMLSVLCKSWTCCTKKDAEPHIVFRLWAFYKTEKKVIMSDNGIAEVLTLYVQGTLWPWEAPVGTGYFCFCTCSRPLCRGARQPLPSLPFLSVNVCSQKEKECGGRVWKHNPQNLKTSFDLFRQMMISCFCSVLWFLELLLYADWKGNLWVGGRGVQCFMYIIDSAQIADELPMYLIATHFS